MRVYSECIEHLGSRVGLRAVSLAPMRITVLAVCCVLFATHAFGQQAPQTQGRSKAVWTGAGLLAAGLIVMPMRHSPISASPDGSRDGRLPVIGLGLAATGGALI
jgi:hypothetical protein